MEILCDSIEMNEQWNHIHDELCIVNLFNVLVLRVGLINVIL
jgi:hypothetical protein